MKSRWLTIMAVMALFFAASITTSVCTMGCGSTGATPISIPVPTGGYINTTAPDTAGKAVVYGYIYADGEFVANAAVTITNESRSENISKGLGKAIIATATTDANGFFSVSITAQAGDTISVRYTDPVTGEESDATNVTVTASVLQMSSSGMVAQDVDIGPGGYAYLVANDGTDSEIIRVSPADGLIDATATFTNKLFDKIAVHTGLNYAAVLDITNSTFYWYDLSNLADDMDATGWDNLTATPHDIAVTDLNETPFTTDEMIVVSHDRNATDGILSIYAIDIGATPTLGFPSTTNCMADPEDETYYPLCSITGESMPLRATELDLVKTPANEARLSVIVEYDSNNIVTHFLYFSQAGTGLTITLDQDVAGATYLSEVLSSDIDPYELIWYDEDTALVTDYAGGTLIGLSDMGGDIAAQTLSVGVQPTGIFPDSDNNRAFVAIQDTNDVVDIDMTSFQLGGNTYDAHYMPTNLVYYSDGEIETVGVILTDPLSLFQLIDVSQ